MYEISPEPLNGFATNSHGRSVWYLAWTCLKVKVNFGGLHAVSLEKSVCFSFTSVLAHFLAVARLSVVCNVRAPYSGGSNFRQYFYSIRYLGHPLTSTENFTEIVAILNLSAAIFRKRCKIGGKLLLSTNRKSYISFRLVPKLVTLNDLERRNGCYFVLFQRIPVASGAHCIKVHICYLIS